MDYPADLLSVSEAARRLGCRPRDVSDMLYQRRVDDSRCPLIGGRRLIPVALLPQMESLLQRRTAQAVASA
jgi:hypothetical protein